MALALPTGRSGRALALALAALAAAVVWLAVASPLVAWHAQRTEAVAARALLAKRMAQIAASLPLWEARARADAAAGPAPGAVLGQPSDAVAAAALQQVVQDLARTAGATLASAEALPAEPAGAYRRIRLRAALSADWPVLVALLQAIGQATPQMTIDDLALRRAPVLLGVTNPPLDASFTVLAFRAAPDPRQPVAAR